MQKRALVTPRNGARVLNAEGSADLEGLNFFNVHWRQVSFYIILPLVSVDIRLRYCTPKLLFSRCHLQDEIRTKVCAIWLQSKFRIPKLPWQSKPIWVNEKLQQLGNWRTWKVLMTNFRIGTSCLSKGLLFRWFYTFYSSRCCSLCSE